MFEGEEESSSVHLDAWLGANRDRLAADVVIISDTAFFEGNVPAITTGLRGLMYAQIDVVGTAVDLHSGGFGGTVQNPANALATIVAGLKDPDGRVAIPGFYDDVEELSADERGHFAALPFDEEAYRAHLDLPELFGEPGFSTLERRGARPTLDVNGMWSGFQGEGSKTIIPAHAHAKVSCRLVSNQAPDVIFERLRAFVEEIAPPGVRTTVRLLGGGRPSLTPVDHPVTRAAAEALEATFGQPAVFVREGGSIPVCASFEETLETPVVLLGFAPADGHAHAPNEWMDLANYETRHPHDRPAVGRNRRASERPGVGPSGHLRARFRSAARRIRGATMHPTSLTGRTSDLDRNRRTHRHEQELAPGCRYGQHGAAFGAGRPRRPQ